MKNKIYKILTVMVLAIFVSACGNKENHNENDGHSHDEEEKTEVNEEHHDEDTEHESESEATDYEEHSQASNPARIEVR